MNKWSGRRITNHPIRTAHRKTKEKNESTIWDLWDNTKHDNLYIIGIPEGEEREKGIKNVFEEIMAKNFPNLKKKTDIKV